MFSEANSEANSEPRLDPSTNTTASLAKLLETSSAKSILDLIKMLTMDEPELERRSVTFLLTHGNLPAPQKLEAAATQAWALWFEVEGLMHSIDLYGGHDSDYENVQDALDQIAEVVADGGAPAVCRQEIQSSALKCLTSGKDHFTGLFNVAKACCHSEQEWHELAETLVASGHSSAGYPDYLKVAIEIYRQTGDRDRYLELRRQRLNSSHDFLDLARFHVEADEMDEAVRVAELGLASSNGSYAHELRMMLADQALAGGKRDQYLEWMFADATETLSLRGYQAFEALCSPDEWYAFEPRLLACVAAARPQTQVGIALHRREPHQALAALNKDDSSLYSWQDSDLRRYARQLETLFPGNLLQYYSKKLGTIERASRRQYAEQAQCIADIKRVMLNLLSDQLGWFGFTIAVRHSTKRLPAFRDELGKVVPDWQDPWR